MLDDTSTIDKCQTPPEPRILLRVRKHMIGRVWKQKQESKCGRGNLVNVKSVMIAVDHVLSDYNHASVRHASHGENKVMHGYTLGVV